MNDTEATKFLALVKVAYPMAYKDVDTETLVATVNMWSREYKNVPYPIMEMALDRFKKHSKFPPTIAEINEELRSIYYKAAEDAFVAKEFGMREVFEKSRAIMEYTFPYKSEQTSFAIDYGRMKALGNGADMLTEGGEV